MLGYYLLASRGLPEGAIIFFGDSMPKWAGYAFWLGSSLILALPWAIFWQKKALGFIGGCIVTAIPPLGLIGWSSPLLTAGALYPDLGWVGLLLTLGLLGLLASIKPGVQHFDIQIKRLAPFVVVAIFSNVIAYSQNEERVLPGWYGVDTQFAGMGSGDASSFRQLVERVLRTEIVEKYIYTMPNNVVYVMPETILGMYEPQTQLSLAHGEEELRRKGSRLIVGAEFPVGTQYQNGFVVLGATENDAKQGFQNIPVPVSMWMPWRNDGAIANIFGHDGLVQVAGNKAGVMICYEQLLSWSILWMFAQEPSILVGMANVWWAKNTSIPMIEKQTMSGYARLFGVPFIEAQNK